MGAVKIGNVATLPAIAPRKAEVTRMVEVLEADYDNAAQAARKATSVAFGLMAEREWFVLTNKIDEDAPVMLYGLFATEAAAQKAATTNSLGLIGAVSVMKVLGLEERAAQLAKFEAQVTHPCADCGHDEAAHNWPRVRVRGCVLPACECVTYVRPGADIPPIEMVA